MTKMQKITVGILIAVLLCIIYLVFSLFIVEEDTVEQSRQLINPTFSNTVALIS